MKRDGQTPGPSPGEGATEPGRYLGCSLPPESALTAQGWQWRGNVDPRREQEIVDTYRELGFDVRVEPLDPDLLCAECDGCRDAVAEIGAIYVRRSRPK